jgi:queuine tRNA-ribosyltransferase
MAGFEFQIQHTDRHSGARRGKLVTPHGTVDTPTFMPVGTHAALRALTPAQVVATGSQIVLANTYHLSIRPGEGLVEKAGGLHRFMAMPLPVLTDSGGFQVFSLDGKEVSEDGVRFRYEKGGERVFLSPERSIEIQEALGADIIMAFDECLPHDCARSYAEVSVDRTTRWAERCLATQRRDDQWLFGIVQGGLWEDLRRRSVQALVPMGFPGYAVGGLSVGEGREEMERVLSFTMPHLPADKPRYLMGIGLPEDLLVAVDHGIDMFDCVIPTRHARGAVLYTFQGRMRISQRRYRRDLYPVDTSCPCACCQGFSRAYLHHLFAAGEVLGTTLAAIHNLTFLAQMVSRMREAIEADGFDEFRQSFLERYLRSGGGRKKGA